MSTHPLADLLAQDRRALLELSGRNRLLNSRIHGSRTSFLRIHDELSEEVFRRLVRGEERMSFRAIDEIAAEEVDPAELGDAEQPAAAEPEPDAPTPAAPASPGPTSEPAPPENQTDEFLQSGLERDKLDKRLLQTFREARTLEEETGVNTLFLVLGFLEYTVEDQTDKPRLAPLVTVPVELIRRDVKAQIRIEARDEPIETNLSLQYLLDLEYGIELPPIPEGEEWFPSQYFDAVEHAIQSKPGWQLRRNEIVLGFYSFTKFLMYRDLDPELWPQGFQLDAHPLLTPLLGEGFSGDCSGPWDETRQLDRTFPPSEQVHVLDADSSQLLAIEKVKAGHNLVIQGPPGTGKSQTITNLIAAAVAEGKNVLFVAEKMAALEVVKRRMDQVGLGHLCLELHSHKANKKEFLRELKESLHADAPSDAASEQELRDLDRSVATLNEHARLMHQRHEPGQLSAYQVLGRLVALRQAGHRFISAEVPDLLRWSDEEYRLRLELCARVVQLLEGQPPAGAHPWYGVRRHDLLPSDRDRLLERLQVFRPAVQALRPKAEALSAAFGWPTPETLAETWRLIEVARHLSSVPTGDLSALADPAWTERAPVLAEFVEHGTRFATHHPKAQAAFGPDCLDWDARSTQTAFLRHGESWLRWLNGEYRAARRELRARSGGRHPQDYARTVQALADQVAAFRCAQLIESDRALGAAAFGSAFAGKSSDWPQLSALHRWVRQAQTELGELSWLEGLSRCADPAALGPAAAELETELRAVEAEFEALRQILDLDLPACLQADGPAEVRLAELGELLGRWLDHGGRLAEWSAMGRGLANLHERGLGSLAELLIAGELLPEDLVATLEGLYHEAWVREIYSLAPSLQSFAGERHEQVLFRFRELDQRRIETAAALVARRHAADRPTGTAGQMGVLLHEMNKKTRHMAIRKLLQEAGAAVQRLKPVFMMSPLSISRFIQPGQLDFDLLLIDEASQVRPVDAYGALLRCRQMAVVGDEKQLPPTSFFRRIGLEEEFADEEVEDQGPALLGSDLESVLSLCLARSVPAQMLSWHYRSQHESLIASSNRYFYDNRLLVVPSAVHEPGRLGLRFHHLPEAIYERGSSRARNPAEAEAVALAAIEHARQFPNESLGIGTFSVSQRDAVLDAVELLLRDHPDVTAFFGTDAAEPFFVKNLENIQGDERDVIFISVGYGRDADGRLLMNFGPLSAEGGDRRMNVLMSRARRRCEVFSSIQAADIDLSRAKSRGVQVLKAFLAYAEHGELDLPIPSGNPADSEFELQVAEALRHCGHEVEHQIGVAGFYVDLAVRDPEQAGRFLLGIECDGASYHASRTARDRDRIRQAILEQRGWQIHRIWSTDWFQDPEKELQRLRDAIEAAARTGSSRWAAVLEQPPPPTPPAATTGTDNGTGEEESAELPLPDSPARAWEIYVEARLDIPEDAPELQDWEPERLDPAVLKIVTLEGPIHSAELARRLARNCGKRRTGKRIQGVVDAALQRLETQAAIRYEDGFFQLPELEHRLRDRSETHSPDLRKPESIARAELAAGIREITEASVRIARDDLPPLIARALGLRATSAVMRARVDSTIDLMLATGVLEEIGGALRLRPEAP